MLDRRSESGVPAMRDMAGASLFMRECILIACVHVNANGGSKRYGMHRCIIGDLDKVSDNSRFFPKK